MVRVARQARAMGARLEPAPMAADLGDSLENPFLDRLIEYLSPLGFRCYHVRHSEESEPGYPDLFALQPPVLLVVETKRNKGRVRPEQAEWLADFAGVRVVRTAVWRPADWPGIAATVAELLTLVPGPNDGGVR